MPRVNNRELLIRNKATGLDPLVDRILKEGSEEARVYKEAESLRNSPVKRAYVEASLLASDDVAAISEILELPEILVRFYQMVFYDVGDLDKLSKMELIEEVEDNQQEYLLKVWALNQGLEFLTWRFGKKVDINPIDGLQELFSMSMYKAKEAMFSGNATEESKSAAQWAKLSMDLARLLKAYTTDNDSIKNDLKLALKSVVPEFKGFDDLKEGL